MLKETGSTEQISSEIKVLRRQVVELRVIEQRCQQAEAALKSFEERNRLLADSAPLGIFTANTQGGVTGISRKMLEMLPWASVDDPKSMNLSDCQAMIESGILADIQRCIDQKEPVIAEHPTTTSPGAWALLRYYLSPMPGSDGTVSGVMAIVEDYTDLKRTIKTLRQSERRFRDQALRDSLTGLYNQRYLYQSLAGCIERAQTNGTPISLIFMDLDHFKQVVDTYGHLNGSRAIREVGRTIGNCLKEPAYAVAYAGDEFVVVLPGMDQTQALQKASEIRSRMQDTVYVLDQNLEVRLKASFGVATWPQHAADSKGLIAAADQALFAIKKTGKDAVGQFQSQ